MFKEEKKDMLKEDRKDVNQKKRKEKGENVKENLVIKKWKRDVW